MTEPRATEEDVRDIFDTEVDLSPHLLYAHLIVETNLRGCGYSEELLTQIEIWLAAHSASVTATGATGGMVTSETEGQLSRSYAQPPSQWFHGSLFGQQAMALDSCGVLAELGKRRAQWRVV